MRSRSILKLDAEKFITVPVTTVHRINRPHRKMSFTFYTYAQIQKQRENQIKVENVELRESTFLYGKFSGLFNMLTPKHSTLLSLVLSSSS